MTIKNNKFNEILKYDKINNNHIICEPQSDKLGIFYTSCEKLHFEMSTTKIYYIITILNTNKSEDINLENIEDCFLGVKNELKKCTWIDLNTSLNLTSSKFYDFDSSHKNIERDIIDCSKNNNIVFFFGDDGVDCWISGVKEKNTNIFYSYKNREEYNKKDDLSKIEKVFQKYDQSHLSKKHNYCKFFVEKYILNKLNSAYKNILINKPEEIMRNDLCDYLNIYVKGTFNVELQLDSERKVDIYTEYNNMYYIFEIKWLGKSINDNGDGVSTEYSHARARDGVKQTIDYIKEIIEKMDYRLKQGYLVVFDARDKKDDIDYQDYNNIEEDKKKYLDYFIRIDALHLDNIRPK